MKEKFLAFARDNYLQKSYMLEVFFTWDSEVVGRRDRPQTRKPETVLLLGSTEQRQGSSMFYFLWG